MILVWFKDISFEGLRGFHNFFVIDGFKIGFAFFIFSEVIFFFRFFWVFFDSSLSPVLDLGDYWPPFGLVLINPFGVPFLNSLVLLSRAITLTWSHHRFLYGFSYFKGLIFTIILGVFFLYIQYVEYNSSFFSFSDGVFGSLFFSLTGFHGLHVLLGVIFLFFNWIRLRNNHLVINHHLSFEFSIIYWHFVDVVWLFLFIFIYWWVFLEFIILVFFTVYKKVFSIDFYFNKNIFFPNKRFII